MTLRWRSKFDNMKIGTKTLLFGVHQFLWHPITVAIAWRRLYGAWPDWREAIAILVHDWGYWGLSEIDGPEGQRHPERGAVIARRVTRFVSNLMVWREAPDREMDAFRVEMQVLNHSRAWCRAHNTPPSKLCWADKASIFFDPPWFYLFRARLSGEIDEYRANAARAGHVPRHLNDFVWLFWYHRKVDTLLHNKGLMLWR